MPGRRRFGRVRKLPSGRCQARYSTPDGREHPASDTFASKTAAERWLSAVETDMARGQWVDPRSRQLLLSAYAATWLAARPDLKIRTRELYQWLLGKYVSRSSATCRSTRSRLASCGTGTPGSCATLRRPRPDRRTRCCAR